MIVAEFMTKDVYSMTQDRSVEDAAKMMLDKNISTLPILDSAGHLVGIISESDFIGSDTYVPHALASIKKVLGQISYDDDVEEVFLRVKSYPLERIMKKNPISVGPDHSLTDVVNLLTSRNLKRIPVVENNKLIGIVTQHDVIRAFTLLTSQKEGLSPES